MHHAFADGLAALSLGLRVLDDFIEPDSGERLLRIRAAT
jgi:hypothetical protein